MIRGAVYRIDLGSTRGHEQRGKRLGLVVSPTDSPLSTVVVIPTSTQARPTVFRPTCQIAGRSTRLLVDQVRAIDTDHLIGGPVDYLTRDRMAEVEVAVGHYLGILPDVLTDGRYLR